MGSLLPEVGVVREGVGILHNLKVNDELNVTESACPDIAPEALSRNDLVRELTPVSADALFDTNSSKLKPDATARLDALIANIKATDKVVATEIIGHTDSSGSDALNIPLSKARAQSVRDYFVLNGLESLPMTTDGMGASRPVADNTTEVGKMANRRVEIIVSRRR